MDYVNEIMESALCAKEDSGETNVLKSVQLIVKVEHVIKIMGNVSNVNEDFGELIALKFVQGIAKIVLICFNVIIAQMDGMVLLVKSRAQITAETADRVTKSLEIAMSVL